MPMLREHQHHRPMVGPSKIRQKRTRYGLGNGSRRTDEFFHKSIRQGSDRMYEKQAQQPPPPQQSEGSCCLKHHRSEETMSMSSLRAY
mmetsp:Transcript_12131/g.28422  ORF Transcript_12131/g.28422 Transcript_12131/m.28422 type:complete len:88 (-) Transcript_12131:603-866(-)